MKRSFPHEGGVRKIFQAQRPAGPQAPDGCMWEKVGKEWTISQEGAEGGMS